jgi:hypothetical protein
LTSKFSRAALVAGLAIGASGLVAVPAEAANGISTANYYVNNPLIGSASGITPESAVVTAAVDTGGSPESLLPVSSSGLSWNLFSGATVTAETWNDGSAPSATTTGNFAPLDGLPASGSNANVGVTITDSGDSAISGKPEPVSNGGADNYSAVNFEYDPVSDYDAADGLPGPAVQLSQAIDVPTTGGFTNLKATIGAFGQAAQNNTGNTPLEPGTKYYFWVSQEAGETDAGTNVNIAQWANQAVNPTPKCYPNSAIAADPTLASYTSTTQITFDGTTAPALQGPCFYYFGNTGGALYYQSPTGTFATPAIGKVAIGPKATATAKGADVTVADVSAYKASGTVALTVGGKLAGTVKFGLLPGGKRSFKVALTAKGKAALAKNKTVKVAPVSQTANVTSVSNWDQPLVGKAVKL